MKMYLSGAQPEAISAAKPIVLASEMDIRGQYVMYENIPKMKDDHVWQVKETEFEKVTEEVFVFSLVCFIWASGASDNISFKLSSAWALKPWSTRALEMFQRLSA